MHHHLSLVGPGHLLVCLSLSLLTCLYGLYCPRFSAICNRDLLRASQKELFNEGVGGYMGEEYC